MLITPEMFSGVFGKTTNSKDKLGDIEGKLKIILLMLEKDLESKFSFRVLTIRPRTLFSTSYFCIDRKHLNHVTSSKYEKYIQ